ncbi:MAG TPA: hypothetical protein VGN36_05465 [Sphingorhabdus sp.]|nr:hypothetical protein [Sphingorhabdus sp.]
MISKKATSLIALTILLAGCGNSGPISEKDKEQLAFDIGADARNALDQCTAQRSKAVCTEAIAKFETATKDMAASCDAGNEYACRYLPKYKEGPDRVRHYVAACIDEFDGKFADPKIKETMDNVCKGQFSS